MSKEELGKLALIRGALDRKYTVGETARRLGFRERVIGLNEQYQISMGSRLRLCLRKRSGSPRRVVKRGEFIIS